MASPDPLIFFFRRLLLPAGRVVLAVHVAAGRIGIPGGALLSENLSIHTHG